jgi:hypothetical protein
MPLPAALVLERPHTFYVVADCLPSTSCDRSRRRAWLHLSTTGRRCRDRAPERGAETSAQGLTQRTTQRGRGAAPPSAPSRGQPSGCRGSRLSPLARRGGFRWQRRHVPSRGCAEGDPEQEDDGGETAEEPSPPLGGGRRREYTTGLLTTRRGGTPPVSSQYPHKLSSQASKSRASSSSRS